MLNEDSHFTQPVPPFFARLLRAQAAVPPAVGGAGAVSASADDSVPASLRAVADATAAPALDSELGLLHACAGGRADALGSPAPADSRWDVATAAVAALPSIEAGDARGVVVGASLASHPLDPLRCNILVAASNAGSRAQGRAGGTPSGSSGWLQAAVWGAVGDLAAAPGDGASFSSASAPALWAACAEPSRRAADASAAIVAAVTPFLQRGQADAFIGALAAPLRPASAAAAQEAIVAGGSSRARLAALTDYERLIAARNVAAALGGLLAGLLPDHVRAPAASGGADGGGSDLPQWVLTARGVLGSGVCSRDEVTRAACAAALASLVRLGSAAFGRRVVLSMEKQARPRVTHAPLF